MPNQLSFIKKENAADPGEELTLTAAIRPPIKGDAAPTFVANYNAAMDTRALMVLVWLIEKLFVKGILALEDFTDFPLLNKINGERIVRKA